MSASSSSCGDATAQRVPLVVAGARGRLDLVVVVIVVVVLLGQFSKTQLADFAWTVKLVRLTHRVHSKRLKAHKIAAANIVMSVVFVVGIVAGVYISKAHKARNKIARAEAFARIA